MENVYTGAELGKIQFRQVVLCNPDLGIVLTKYNKKYIVRSLEESENILSTIKIYSSVGMANHALDKIDIRWSYYVTKKFDFLEESEHWKEKNRKEKAEKIKEFLRPRTMMITIDEV